MKRFYIKKKYLYNLFFISIFMFIAGCEKNVTVDLPSYQTQVVVNGFFTPDQNFKVELTNRKELLACV